MNFSIFMLQNFYLIEKRDVKYNNYYNIGQNCACKSDYNIFAKLKNEHNFRYREKLNYSIQMG